jgi:hypothetical protein
MSTEAIISLVAIGVTVMGALIATLIKVFTALQRLADATERLIKTMDDHDDRIDEHDERLDNHEVRIVRIEQTHKLKGCDRGIAATQGVEK